MAQTPRDLDPGRDARSQFGFQLRERRVTLGLSQARLGAELYVSGDAVATWERGRSLPDLAAAQRLDTVLGANGLLFAVWRFAAENNADRHADTSRADRHADRSNTAATGRLPPGDTHFDEAAVLAAAASEAAAFGSWAERLAAGEVAIEALHIRARHLAAASLTRPPSGIVQEAAALNREAFRLIRKHRKPVHARDLYAIAGQVCALLAWLSGDLGALDEAEMHGRTAAMCADYADQPELSAWVHAVRSKTAFWRGDFLRAADIAERGARFAAPGTVGVMLACQRADAFAMLGAADLALDALRLADEAAERVRGGDSIGGLFSCNDSRHANYAAGAHVALGHTELALAEADRALAALDQSSAHGFGTIGQVHVSRALAHATADRLDAAADAARPVLELEPERRLATLTERLRPLAQSLGRPAMRGSAVARELRVDLAEFCGSRGARLQLSAPTHFKEPK